MNFKNQRDQAMTKNVIFEIGSGNVFEDIGLPNPELEHAKANEELKKFRSEKLRDSTPKKHT